MMDSSALQSIRDDGVRLQPRNEATGAADADPALTTLNRHMDNDVSMTLENNGKKTPSEEPLTSDSNSQGSQRTTAVRQGTAVHGAMADGSLPHPVQV